MGVSLSISVRNQSGRNGAKPSLIVIHTTEGHERPGVSDLYGLASWFNNPASQASSHVGNDAEGNEVRMVPDSRKAWTQAMMNPVSLSAELIGFARETRKEWLAQPKQLEVTAQRIATWSKAHNIPIRRGSVSSGGSVRMSGVVSHDELPGTHTDPGKGFPWDVVLKRAREIKVGLEPRKVKKWKRSLQIVRAKAARRGWLLPYRLRARKLKKLIEREEK